jgi:hypothetical protein
MVTRLDLKGPRGSRLSPCDGCAKGKHHQAPFPKHAQRRAKHVIEHLHCDLQGPFEKLINGYKYVMVVMDDYS